MEEWIRRQRQVEKINTAEEERKLTNLRWLCTFAGWRLFYEMICVHFNLHRVVCNGPVCCDLSSNTVDDEALWKIKWHFFTNKPKLHHEEWIGSKMAVGLDMLNRPVVSASLRIQRTKERGVTRGGGGRERESYGWKDRREDRRWKVNCHQWGGKQAEKVLDIGLCGPEPVLLSSIAVGCGFKPLEMAKMGLFVYMHRFCRYSNEKMQVITTGMQN